MYSIQEIIDNFSMLVSESQYETEKLIFVNNDESNKLHLIATTRNVFEEINILIETLNEKLNTSIEKIEGPYLDGVKSIDVETLDFFIIKKEGDSIHTLGVIEYLTLDPTITTQKIWNRIE